uniref:AP-1 complex subunit sigma-3 n=1 Tax=Sphaerodactylus townsendi TaxID=933632 RepID=A0ACB8FAR3_9SAUR
MGLGGGDWCRALCLPPPQLPDSMWDLEADTAALEFRCQAFAGKGIYLIFLLIEMEIHFVLLFSRQGKLRLQKWFITLPEKEKKKITREIVQIILARNPKMSSFVDWKDLKLVYKRYASLYFCCGTEDQDNELLTLEVVHRYVELLDRYFGNVCELDIIFNFEKAYFILDEFLMGGEIQETSKKSAVKAIEDADMLQETA